MCQEKGEGYLSKIKTETSFWFFPSPVGQKEDTKGKVERYSTRPSIFSLEAGCLPWPWWRRELPIGGNWVPNCPRSLNPEQQ